MAREPDRVRKIAFDAMPGWSASQAILHTLRRVSVAPLLPDDLRHQVIDQRLDLVAAQNGRQLQSGWRRPFGKPVAGDRGVGPIEKRWHLRARASTADRVG